MSTTGSDAPLLVTSGLSLAYERSGQVRRVVDDVTLALQPNRIVGLAGESGCGKTTLALTLTGYRPPGLRIEAGSVRLGDQELTAMERAPLRRLWGHRIAYLPQDTSTALNPALRIGAQFTEPLRTHLGMTTAAARARALELLEQVRVPGGNDALHRFPHQFSGGQQQRLALAIALSCGPEVLILDEPTTGLDVTTQAEINRLIAELGRQRGTVTLYVSHNLALLGTICDELLVMYGGRIVELGPAPDVYATPAHPYTDALIAAVPSIERSAPPEGIPGMPPLTVVQGRCGYADRCTRHVDACDADIALTARGAVQVRCIRPVAPAPAPLRATDDGAVAVARAGELVLDVRDLRCTYGSFVAVEGMSFALRRGEALGIAGESGSGKSTALRALIGLLAPASGTIELHGAPLHGDVTRRTAAQRRAMQIVFQNPDATLNPRHTVFEILERPLKLFRPGLRRAERRDVAATALDRMRLRTELLDRYPRHLSGGQRQRVALARAVIAEPEVILCDEVTSALDVSVQATIIELLLAELESERRPSIVFVTHDLGVLRALTDDLLVMQDGEVREHRATADVLTAPADPYTARLIASLPKPFARRGTQPAREARRSA